MNPEVDGYNGEQGGNSLICGEGERAVWRCKKCDSIEGRLFTCFGYQYEVSADDATLSRIQDFFDAFVISHECQNVERVVRVVALEVA
jgi:hypothetical protein